MSIKRDLDEVDSFSDSDPIPEPNPKRSKKQQQSSKKAARQSQNPSIDPTWGQRYVFPSSRTTVPEGEESDFEDDSDAMAYLLSVRQEAGGMPHLLVAPKRQIGPQVPAGYRQSQELDDLDEGEIEYDEREISDQAAYTDTRGYYEDGAYVALPEDEIPQGQSDDGDEDEASDTAIHEAYYTSLLQQYSRLRSILNTEPSPKAAESLPPSHPTNAAPFSRTSNTTGQWSKLLRTTDPLPLQLALMSKDTILRVLRILIGGKFLHQGHQISERTSRWLWALLARLPPPGELNHEEVGWVRDLGRRAVLLGRSLAEMAALREELEDGSLGMHDGVGQSDEEGVDETEDAAGATGDADGQGSVSENPKTKLKDTPNASQEALLARHTEQPDLDDGEAEDVAMDLASTPPSSDREEGEASETEPAADLASVKSRLLSQLQDQQADSDREIEDAHQATVARSRMNMRATLNMVLTVAGEFYGQRDLLEFREPFVGM